MKAQDLAELISLGLTVPTIFFSALVVIAWLPSSLSAIRKDEKTASDWFVLGVCIGFMGATFDNFYWQIAWSASYLELDSASWWMENGVFPNIFSRQSLGLAAAYCHLRSWRMHRVEGSKGVLPFTLLVGTIGMLFYPLVMLVLK